VQIDPVYMRRAISLAAPESTHPNPRVGAIVIDPSGEVVGEGAHTGVGSPHAEVVALERARDKARGSTMYVTLEPCSHHGVTPPCIDSIVASGVATVVVGAMDPDVRVSGSGISGLRAAGVEVVTDVLAAEAEAVDPAYFHHRRTGLPRVTLKLAMTLDGAVAAADGTSKWITSEPARADGHHLRASMDAVVIGAGTLRLDDPLLTARLGDPVVSQPVPVVVAGGDPLPEGSRIWTRAPLVISAGHIDLPGGELIVVSGEGGRPDPELSARALAERGLLDLLLEGGPTLAGAWWRAGLVGRGVVYVAGRVGGGAGRAPLGGVFGTMAESRVVTVRDIQMVGPDIRIEFQ
jgi:diaminohydroxyphosphoribosylaminopyrimidine deaminase/5-amino-6-(5-phosphoribosylamino)uracil reductase